MSVKKYCYCENNCKYETMSKEEILAAIAQAVETGKIGECDTGFITTVKTINGLPLKFFVGAQSDYEVLTAEQKSNLFAIITNDTTKEGILNAIKELQDIMDGVSAVPKANYSEQARWLGDCVEPKYDDVGKGFIITQPGVYLIIGRLETEYRDCSDIVVIKDIGNGANGMIDIACYQYVGEIYQYRLKFTKENNYTNCRAFKIMNL